MGKRETPIEVLFDVLTRVPTWVGPVLAGVVFVGMRYAVPYFLFPDKPASAFESSFNKTLASFAKTIAPFLSAGVLVLWAAAEVKKLFNRRLLAKTEGIEDIRRMSWREFESLVGEAYRRQGYDVQETGSASGDGGIDMMLERGGEKSAVQCKRWRDRQVGAKVARELYGSMADAGAARGIIVCCGEFTADAEAFAERNGIELVTGRSLVSLIAEAKGGTAARSNAGSERAASPARAGAQSRVAAVPACPVCGSPMRIVTARTKFWGCPKYPKCRGTRQLE